MIKYRTRTYDYEIVPVEIDNETDSHVILKNGKRERKRSQHHMFHETWFQARQHLVERVERKMAQLSSDYKIAQRVMQKLLKMEPV